MLELVHQQALLPQVHLLAVVLLAVVLQVLAVVLQVPAAAVTKKPYRQKNTPNFFRGILVIKSRIIYQPPSISQPITLPLTIPRGIAHQRPSP